MRFELVHPQRLQPVPSVLQRGLLRHRQCSAASGEFRNCAQIDTPFQLRPLQTFVKSPLDFNSAWTSSTSTRPRGLTPPATPSTWTNTSPRVWTVTSSPFKKAIEHTSCLRTRKAPLRDARFPVAVWSCSVGENPQTTIQLQIAGGGGSATCRSPGFNVNNFKTLPVRIGKILLGCLVTTERC